MFLISYEMAKLDYEERLHWAEQERLVGRILANRPRLYMHLLEKLGDLLIIFGTHLKTQMQKKYKDLLSKGASNAGTKFFHDRAHHS